MPGYSGTPLPKKLGIKPNETVILIAAPTNYAGLLGEIPPGVIFSKTLKGEARFVHLFTKERAELKKQLAILRRQLADDGTLWVSWPKKTSGVPTDVTEDVIREVALPLGFVDIKVCAVSDIWSGLKLMIRRGNRRN